MATATKTGGVIQVLAESFLGHTPRWYKQAIVLGLTDTHAVYKEVERGLPVLAHLSADRRVEHLRTRSLQWSP